MPLADLISAAEAILRIDRAAEGRTLTKAQAADRDSARDRLNAEWRFLPGRFGSPTDYKFPDEWARLVTEARRLQREQENAPMATHPHAERLRHKRSEVIADMRAMLDVADREKRELTAAEDSRYNGLNAELAEVDAEIAKFNAQEARAKAADEHRSRVGQVIAHGTSGDAGELTSLYLEARDGRAGAFDSGYSRGFLEQRALSDGSIGAGTAFPVTFADSVTVYERQLSPILGLATVMERPSGAPMIFPRLTADPNLGGTVTAEAAALTEADPTISSVEIPMFKYGAVTVWSAELDEDNLIGLRDLVARSAARELSLDYANHLTNGTGTVQPFGIMERAGNGGTALGTAAVSGQNFVSWVDMASLYGSVPAPYRSTGTFVVADSLYISMLKWRDTSGQPILQQGLGSTPATLFGRPVVVDPNMTALGSATKSAMFGDISRYHIIRTPMRIEVSRDYKFSTDQVAIKVVTRIGGDLVDTSAVKYLVSASA